MSVTKLPTVAHGERYREGRRGNVQGYSTSKKVAAPGIDKGNRQTPLSLQGCLPTCSVPAQVSLCGNIPLWSDQAALSSTGCVATQI